MQIPTVPEGDDTGTQLAERTNLQVEIPQELAGVFNLADNMEGVVPRLPQIKIICLRPLKEEALF